MTNCRRCKIELTKPDSKIFCSRSCAAIYNNTRHPKRVRVISSCINCKKDTEYGNRKFCVSCIKQRWDKTWPLKPLKFRTLKEELLLNPEKGANKYNRIRGSLRNEFKAVIKKQKCKNCGYDKHVEICHIKPISVFPLNALIKTVNSRSNAVLLCPNCHWELDNGKLKL